MENRAPIPAPVRRDFIRFLSGSYPLRSQASGLPNDNSMESNGLAISDA